MLVKNTKGFKLIKHCLILALLSLRIIFMGCLETGYGDWGYSGGFSSDYSGGYSGGETGDTAGSNSDNSTSNRVQKDNSYNGNSTQPYIKSRESKTDKEI
jgi:hypothetical protein